MSRRIRAVEHRKSAALLADTQPRLKDRILLNCTIIGNVHKDARNLAIFCYV